MEYFDKSKICREFLKQYSEALYPELLPKLMKVAIYSLYKAYHKWTISMQEIDEFINFFNYKNRNFELEQNVRQINNNNKEEESKYNYDCPPCDEYYIPKNKKIKKLNIGYTPRDYPQSPGYGNTPNPKDSDGFGKFYPNDEVYINDSNNFYDENYYIPRTRSYRNLQLYHKRLSNPKFITQEKRIYPHWWWNLKDDIEQDDYSDDDSEMDHRPSKPGRFPKNLEEKLKKKMKRQIRNKSFNGVRSIRNQYYDEDKIFPNVDRNNNINTSNNENTFNNNDYENMEKYPYPNKGYPPYDNNEMRRPYGGTATDGFGRPFLNPENNNIRMNNSVNINESPSDMNNPNLNYRNAPNTLGLNNSRNNYGMNPNNENGNNNDNIDNRSQNNNNLTKENNSYTGANVTGSNFSSSTLKNQIMNKRMMKESTFLSFDKDFNVNGIKKKVRGKAKKGVKYSVSGNQLNEDKRGIRRRKK
jgi:hypothetical protein